VKNNIKHKLISATLQFLFLMTVYITHNIGSLYYNAAQSPDYGKYRRYLDYYLGDALNTNFEQGNLYYYLVSKFIDFGSNNVHPRNFEEYISYSIHLTNLFLFLIFLFGAYKVFIILGFKKNTVLTGLILLNFFPPLMSIRLIYKPEILILSLFIWCIFFLERYLDSSKITYIIYFCFTFSLLISTKFTGAIMISIFLVARYFSSFWTNSRKIFGSASVAILIFFIILSYENYLINDIWFFNTPTADFYDKKAGFNFIYNINFMDLIYHPYKDFHKDSLIGIILLETFNDYFQLYWKSDESLFAINHMNLISNLDRYIGVFSTIIFYLSILILSIRKFDRSILLSPFIGIITMLLISMFIVFDPSSGDMLKNYYYSFLLTICFLYVLLICIKETKYLKYFIIVTYLLSSLFILGFPKNHTAQMKDRLSVNNSVTISCSLNSKILDLKSKECETTKLEVCNDIFSTYEKTEIVNGQIINIIYDPLDSYELIKNNNITKISTNDDCYKLVSEGYSLNDSFSMQKNAPPINLFAFLLPFLSMSIFKLKNKYLDKSKF
jgi:hypothetical protein